MENNIESKGLFDEDNQNKAINDENSSEKNESNEDKELKDSEIKKEQKDEGYFQTINYYYVAVGLMVLTGALLITIIVLACLCKSKDSKPEWEPKGDDPKTDWGDDIDIEKIWQEYPRPQMEREDWKNLNGLWNYSITRKESLKPKNPDGTILVPFPVESSLSGVKRSLNQDQIIWYQREFEIPDNWKDKNILLHFGAVDWKCDVYVNYQPVGNHEGGYSPFYFDITRFTKMNQSNTLIVKVYDPTDLGYQPVGKQTIVTHNDSHIWYTPSSGIWQTVWMEPVFPHHFEKIIFKNNFDNKQIILNAPVQTQIKLQVQAFLYYNGEQIANVWGNINEDLTFSLEKDNFHPWSPEEPNLYNITVVLYSLTNKTYDYIHTYTAIRKISSEKDSKGKIRIKLNNKVYFNMGVLDQGYFPDGLYTPPSEEAMIFDIQKAKDFGFNTIRKHVKVECARFYYNCDKIGMLVWQDMPNGDRGGNEHDPSKIDGGTEKNRTEDSKNNFYKEWADIITFCGFFQSVIVYVPFNEAWGQFETVGVAQKTKELDPSRLVDPASGGNYRLSGDVFDLHHYSSPLYYLSTENYSNVFGEFGGLGYVVEGHTWSDEHWSYKTIYNTTDEVIEELTGFYEKLKKVGDEGISSAIYTQITDVEEEVNGLITYDRKVVKYDENIIKKFNQDLLAYLNE